MIKRKPFVSWSGDNGLLTPAAGFSAVMQLLNSLLRVHATQGISARFFPEEMLNFSAPRSFSY
jgi:hypothetical protein